MKRLTLIIFLMGFLILSLPRMGWGGEMGEDKGAEKKKEPVTLPELVVTAFPKEAITITPTSTIIDVEKYVQSGTVERVEDILRQMTGIDVMRSSVAGDPQQVLMLRGFDDSRFTVAIDGRPITAPTAGQDTFVDWSSLTTGDIEKIEVIRGGASALYDNSQGGIINLITKKGRRRVTLVPKITLRSDYSSFNTYVERMTVDGGIGNLGYLFNFGYKESDGYLRNNNWRGNEYSGRLTYLFPFQGNLTLSYRGTDLEMGYPVVNDPNRPDYNSSYPTVPEDADTLRKFRTISYPGGDSYKEKEVDHLDFIFEQPIRDTSLKLHLFQTRGAEDSWTYVLSGKKLVQQFGGGDDRKETTRGGILQYRLNLWENNFLTLGYDHRRMEVESMKDIYRIQAGYFEDIWRITSKLTLNLGLRYSHIRELSYPYADPGTTMRYRHKIKYDVWLPKSTLSYRFRPDTEVYLSINRDYHLPGC